MDISLLVNQLSDELDDKAYQASAQLAKIGSDEVLATMIGLLENSSDDTKIMAARTLGLMENNADALDAIFEAIEKNPSISGELLVYLEDFDLSDKYVPIFKLSLFGGFKVATVAQDLLDHQEFDITPRVLKKAEKAWNHYVNNVKHDDVFELKKQEVEEMLADLKAFIESE